MFNKRKAKKLIRQSIEEGRYGSFEEFKEAVEEIKKKMEDLPNPPPPPSAIIGKKNVAKKRRRLPVPTISTIIILILMLLVMIVAVPVIVLKIEEVNAKVIDNTMILNIKSIEKYNSEYGDKIFYFSGDGVKINEAWIRKTAGKVDKVCERYTIKSDDRTLEGVMEAVWNIDKDYIHYLTEFSTKVSERLQWNNTTVKYVVDNSKNLRMVFSINGVIYHISVDIVSAGQGNDIKDTVLLTLSKLKIN